MQGIDRVIWVSLTRIEAGEPLTFQQNQIMDPNRIYLYNPST